MSAHAKPHSIKPYLIVFGSLMVLTVVTVGVSYLDMPRPLALTVGIAIAVFKASLVALFFMHLKDEGKLIWSLLGLCAVFLVVLFSLPWSDMRGNLAAGRSHKEPVVMDAPHPAEHAEAKAPAPAKKAAAH